MRLHARCAWLSFAVVVVVPLLADAACPDPAAVASYVADFKAGRVSKGFGKDLTIADAECAKSKTESRSSLEIF